MSAYGTIPKPSFGSSQPLLPRSYSLPSASSVTALTIIPVTKSTIPDDLLRHVASIFDDVVDEGRTYPQERKLGKDGFRDYFLAYDCFIGLLEDLPSDRFPKDVSDTAPSDSRSTTIGPFVERGLSDTTLESVRAGREWKDCVGGMYYVKPNYPGRSSHCCNAGFVVDPRHRGLKIGLALGTSYLHYGPLLGYRASVFNLVYANNVASLRIWDKLGFQRVGLIPGAGRLAKREVGGGEEVEEYVDAVVYWKSFV